MRTTINLPDDVLVEAKRLAHDTGRTLTKVIEDSLRERLARRSRPSEVGRVLLPTFGHGGVMPGVDLDNSAALLDLMDEPA